MGLFRGERGNEERVPDALQARALWRWEEERRTRIVDDGGRVVVRLRPGVPTWTVIEVDGHALAVVDFRTLRSAFSAGDVPVVRVYAGVGLTPRPHDVPFAEIAGLWSGDLRVEAPTVGGMFYRTPEPRAREVFDGDGNMLARERFRGHSKVNLPLAEWSIEVFPSRLTKGQLVGVMWPIREMHQELE